MAGLEEGVGFGIGMEDVFTEAGVEFGAVGGIAEEADVAALADGFELAHGVGEEGFIHGLVGSVGERPHTGLTRQVCRPPECGDGGRPIVAVVAILVDEPLLEVSPEVVAERHFPVQAFPQQIVGAEVIAPAELHVQELLDLHCGIKVPPVFFDGTIIEWIPDYFHVNFGLFGHGRVQRR